ncbi:MAG: class I SAM-dependent methyltransferase, partial [Candidatus Heimdallarchaeaceae archaeon]
MSHDEHSGLIRDFFDEFGNREWYRFVDNPQNRVAFHIHNHYLKQYIRPGDKIFEIGAGPGRFTIEIAKTGASICVGDLSKTQLQLNEEKVKTAGYEDSVIWRKQLDVTDLSEIADEEFDSSVCYGGPLSYVFDKAPQALSELLRITKTRGYILLSVMSHLGSLQCFIGAVYNQSLKSGLDEVNNLVESGDVIGKLAS